MHPHRFTSQWFLGQRVETFTPTAQGFILCPVPLQPGWLVQPCPCPDIYRLAFEQAQAVVRPSLLERWQRASEN
jgi:hypothetical protein